MLRNLLMFSGVDERCVSFVLKAKACYLKKKKVNSTWGFIFIIPLIFIMQRKALDLLQAPLWHLSVPGSESLGLASFPG